MINWFNNWRQRSKARKLLIALGENSREVANTLMYVKAIGKPHSNTSCPLARFLSTKGIKVMIGVSNLCLLGDDQHFIDLPKPCTAFVHDFDHGAYPFLSEGEK